MRNAGLGLVVPEWVGRNEWALAIDPGEEKSGLCWYVNGELHSATLYNSEVAEAIADYSHVYVEMIAPYGKAGSALFETICWIGRFFECAGGVHDRCKRLYRRDIKQHLCGTDKVKDAEVREALIDRFGPGKERAIGTKKAPGPLYGVKSHEWAALAVLVTALDRLDLHEEFP